MRTPPPLPPPEGLDGLQLCYLNSKLKMQGREEKVQAELDHLINCLHRNAPESTRANYHSFARKLFSTTAGRPNHDSLADLRQKIIVKVTNTHDQRSVLHCQEVLQRFAGNSTLQRKQEILRMLLKLSDLSSRAEEDLSSLFREVRKKDLNQTVETNISALSNAPPPQPKRNVQLVEQLRMVRNRGSAEQGVSQGDLVRQLSFVFTNNSSSDIVEATDGYQLRSSLNVTDTVRRMIAELADLGWLHRRISKESEKEGAVRRALRVAVQQELNEYYRWIGTMEGLCNQGRLSLRKLQVWAFNPTELLKWLAVVLEAVEPFEGSHILSILNAYRPNGMAAVDALLSRLLSHALQPLLNYIHRWTYFGDLQDPSGEFFIAENKKVYDSEEWQERFRVVAEKVPSVLDSECARMIFSTGKAIHFLLNRCKVLYQVRTPFLDLSNLEDPAALLAGPFRSWLTELHAEVSRALVQTLFGQFHLNHHLQSIKSFFLAGKGDFIQQLYDTLREKLSQKKQEITEHSLDGYISDAITKCFSDFALPDGKSFRSHVADRLLAKKIELGSGSEGWDCFNFQYSLERIEPLQVLFTPEVMLGYQKIFAFLWRVKQVEETLKTVWVAQGREEALRMRRIRSKELQELFHQGYLLRSAMLHCISSLHSFLMVTLEEAWSKFASDAAAATTLDDLLARHRVFQQEALEIALCTPREKNLQLCLANLFSTITNFRVANLRLQESFDDYYEKLRLYEDRQAMARRGIGVEYLQVPEISLGKSGKDLREVKSVFETSVRNLFVVLRKECEGKVSNLSVLAAKLDFSQYYSNLYFE